MCGLPFQDAEDAEDAEAAEEADGGELDIKVGTSRRWIVSDSVIEPLRSQRPQNRKVNALEQILWQL